MAKNYDLLKYEAIQRMCEAIRESYSVADVIDDESLATNSTFSSVKIDNLLKDIETVAKKYTDDLNNTMASRVDKLEKSGGSGEVPSLVMAIKGTPNNGYLKTYQFTYGDGETFEVDIPKDLVVTRGEVITVSDDTPVSNLTNGTYLKLTIANQTEPVYINVVDLCDVYTGKTATDGVSISVSDTNEISATLVGKAVTESNLEDTLVVKINNADEALTWGTIV